MKTGRALYEERHHIVDHYHQEKLIETIEKILADRHAIDSLAMPDLAAFDEMHVGGREASLSLARKARLQAGDLLLDVGCGVGGPSRMLSHGFGMRVVGLDLTASYCRIASALSQAVKGSVPLGFINGDALALPFKPAIFDVIWTQHCSMNISNKEGLYHEFKRILQKGGRLLIHDIVQGVQSPVLYPTPWAMSSENSFLQSKESLGKTLQNAGFKVDHWEIISEQALEWYARMKASKFKRKPPLFSQKLLFGDALPMMAGNMRKNLQEHRIEVLEAICTRK